MKKVTPKKLTLLKSRSLYCYKDNRSCEFKETTNKRYFAWIHTNEEKTEGYCVELLRVKLDYYIKRNKETEKFLAGNTDPKNRYNKNPIKEAHKQYKSKDNIPFCWGYVINENNYGHLYVKELFLNSDHALDDKGEIIKYDRTFFESIILDDSERDKLLSKLKSILKKEDVKLLKEYSDCSEVEPLKRLIATIQLEYFFIDNKRRMEKDLKKLLPKIKKDLKGGIAHRIHFSTDYSELSYDSYYNRN